MVWKVNMLRSTVVQKSECNDITVIVITDCCRVTKSPPTQENVWCELFRRQVTL